MIVLVISLFLVLKVDQSHIFSSDAQADSNFSMAKFTLLKMDNMMLFFVLGTSLFVIISAYFANNHPAFFFFGILLLMVALILAAVMSNTYDTFKGTSQMNESASNFSKTNLVMSKMPLYILFIGFLTLISMYAGYKGQ